ncbi:hypothetical protein [Myxococcus landrumensis]|uniref:Lipoprotein n=1 Tax=Myxococcus landrumensis TaxID=2813577 RepID=A0ABX7N551_9BACT|nr:hypothetical protein [Myxococcus landrumus]QSQ12817.1 hypothetical protein JY572_31385 [Myxococcus landrumus]
MRSERAGRGFQGWRVVVLVCLLWGAGLGCGSGKEAPSSTSTPAPGSTAQPSEVKQGTLWGIVSGGTQDDTGTGVAVGRDGDVVMVVSQTPRQDGDRAPVAGERLGVVVARYSSEGKVRWTRVHPRMRLSELRVAASPGTDGAVFLSGNAFLYSANFGLGEAQDGFLVRFSEDGMPEWQRRVGQKAWSSSADLLGGVLVAGEEWDGEVKDPVLTHFAADGSVRWTRRFAGTKEGTALRAAAVAPSGRAVLAGQLVGKLEVDGKSFGDEERKGFVVLEFDESGKLVWGRELPGAEGRVTSVAVGPEGLVTVAGDFKGLLMWGGTSLGTSGPFVLGVGAEGEVRWLKQPECGDESSEGVSAAVDDAGSVAVVCGDALTRFDADGAGQESRKLPPQDCSSGQCLLSATGIATAPGQGWAVTGWQRDGAGVAWNQDAFLRVVTPR